MDATKWQNIVQIDTRSEVLTAGLSYRVGKQSSWIGRVWTQLFGEGFDKTRLAQNILKELNDPSSDEFLKTVDATERASALTNLGRLKAKFKRSGASSAVSILDECILKIGRVIYERSQSTDGIDKPRLLSDASSVSIGPESPRELTARSVIGTVDFEKNKAQINEDIRAYSPDIQTAMQERMRLGWANGRVFDPKEVRKMANEMVLEKLVGRFSKENVNAALKAYCGDRPDRMNYNAFITLVNMGCVKLDNKVATDIEGKCKSCEVKFKQLLNGYFDHISDLPMLGKEKAISTTQEALHKILGISGITPRQAYLAVYRKFIFGTSTPEKDPIAEREILRDLPIIKITPQQVLRMERFVQDTQLRGFLRPYANLAIQERDAAGIIKPYETKRLALTAEIDSLAREREDIERKTPLMNAAKLNLESLVRQHASASSEDKKAIGEMISYLSLHFADHFGGFEERSKTVSRSLEDKRAELDALNGAFEAKPFHRSLQTMRDACRTALLLLEIEIHHALDSACS